jgi:ABC-type transport system involved in multi-copper enzyme maturation permease subunit
MIQGAMAGPRVLGLQPLAIWTIMRLTVRETARRKLLLALQGLTAVVIAVTLFGVYKLKTINDPTGVPLTPLELKTVVSQILILIMFMFSFVLALSAVFVAAPQISGDVESGISLAILTRPLSRADVVLGKWLGLFALVSAYIAGAVAIELVGVKLITDYVPPSPVLLIAYLVGETVTLMTLALLISTRLSGMTGGVIALGAYGISWLGGIAGAVGEAFQNSTVTHIGTATQLLLPTDGLWRGAVYSMEPAAIITVARAAGGAGRAASANPFFQTTGPPIPYIAWAGVWLVVMLGLTIYSFHRREI